MFKKQKQEKNKIEFLIKLTKEEWETYVTKAYEESKGKYPVQGFRKGKVPRKVIEQNYGASIFFDDAYTAAVSSSFLEILKQNPDIEPVTMPNANILKFDDNGLEVSMVIITKPEVKLGEYKDLKIVSAKGKVSNDQINAEINQMRDRGARFVPVERPAKMGDFVVIDFNGKVDGKEFEGGKSEDYRLELGSHTFIDTFEDQIVGMNIGEKRIIKVTFPDNYVEELKNKPAEFDVILNKVEEKQLPELNDEFASNVSEFETLAELKADIKKHLEESLVQQLTRETENKIIDTIVDASQVEVPDEMVEEEFENQIKDYEAKLAYRGITFKDYLTFNNTTLEDYKKQNYENVRKYVKTSLVINKLVKTENLDATDKELDIKLQEIATKNQKTLEDYKKSINENELYSLKNGIIIEKLLNFLKSNNEII